MLIGRLGVGFSRFGVRIGRLSLSFSRLRLVLVVCVCAIVVSKPSLVVCIKIVVSTTEKLFNILHNGYI